MSLSFVIYPAGNNLSVVLNWPANTELSVAITNMLAISFPGVTVQMNIGSYVTGYDQHGYHETMDEMGQVISELTDGNVQIVLQNGILVVSDSTYIPPAKKLIFTDLIGQPTWLDVNIIQVKTVMRADISVSSIFTLPEGASSVPGQIITLGGSLPSSPNINYQTTFKGNFKVVESRQIGNSRSPDGSQWASIFNAVPV